MSQHACMIADALGIGTWSIRFRLLLPSPPAESLFGEAKVLPALEALFHLSDSKGDDCADPAARTRLLCIPPC